MAFLAGLHSATSADAVGWLSLRRSLLCLLSSLAIYLIEGRRHAPAEFAGRLPATPRASSGDITHCYFDSAIDGPGCCGVARSADAAESRAGWGSSDPSGLLNGVRRATFGAWYSLGADGRAHGQHIGRFVADRYILTHGEAILSGRSTVRPGGGADGRRSTCIAGGCFQHVIRSLIRCAWSLTVIGAHPSTRETLMLALVWRFSSAVGPANFAVGQRRGNSNAARNTSA